MRARNCWRPPSGIFGKGELALAKHHQLKAAQAWDRKDPKATGRDLDAASVHLKHALAWLRDGFDAVERQAMKQADRAGLVLTREQLIEADNTAAALVKGTGWNNAGVKAALGNVAKEIDALQQTLAKGQRAAGKRR